MPMNSVFWIRDYSGKVMAQFGAAVDAVLLSAHAMEALSDQQRQFIAKLSQTLRSAVGQRTRKANMSYAYLALAIAFEVVATSFSRAIDGFTACGHHRDGVRLPPGLLFSTDRFQARSALAWHMCHLVGRGYRLPDHRDRMVVPGAAARHAGNRRHTDPVGVIVMHPFSKYTPDAFQNATHEQDERRVSVQEDISNT